MIKLKPRTRIILLSVISILIVVTIVLGITYSFMQANIESSSVTEVSLSSCANITLTDTGESINLSNSYPMTKNRAFETTPYTFTVSSSCTDGSGFNLYLATLNTNTLDASNIHYIITEHGNKNVITEGILSEATNGVSDFQDYELNELNNGINGTYGSIYRLHSSGINYNTEVTYDLYLYIDESVTNETMGQTFSAGLAVKASDYDFATVDEVTVTDATNDSITVSVDASNGTNNIANYYYSINNGEYVSSTSNTYTFEGLDTGTTYDIKVYVVDANGVQSNVYSTNGETSDVVYLASYITGLYTSDGENDLYYHDGNGTYGSQEAGDNSYRYAGANPNNYVCFGSDETSCPTDNLYRIIGVFNGQVKLIKLTSIGYYSWDTNEIDFSSIAGINNQDNNYKIMKLGGILAAGEITGNGGRNIWSDADLNYYINNDYFYDTLAQVWQNKIAIHTWQVGGITTSERINLPKTVYGYEVSNNSTGTTYSAKIGLMYVSDYGFGASPEAWSGGLEEYTNTNNWLYLSGEWFISRSSDSENYAYIMSSNGKVSIIHVNSSGYVRPSFYLNSDALYISGTGTQSDPYRIA